MKRADYSRKALFWAAGSWPSVLRRIDDVLVTDVTGNYQLILPMMITTRGATLVTQWWGGRSIYSQLLERTLQLAARPKRGESSVTAG